MRFNLPRDEARWMVFSAGLRHLSEMQYGTSNLRRMFLFAFLFCLTFGAFAQAPAEANAAFDTYARQVEARLARQHASAATFLPVAPANEARLLHGGFVIEQLSPSTQPDGAMLHHWRGTAFVAGATAADFDHLLRDFPAYPRTYAPQVIRARVLSGGGDHLQAAMRVQQQHVITVVMDTTYDVRYAHLDAHHGSSASRSTHIAEIDSPGTRSEHALSSADEHGFLWRLNSYWSYEERNGGLYIQIESISLTRSIPTGLGWIVRPFVESVPRESLEFTLRSTAKALHK